MHQLIGPDTLAPPEERVVLDEDFGFEIPCEGHIIWPERIAEHDDPARWIGLKKCGHHRFFCGECKEFYLNMMAHDPWFTCRECGEKDSQFIGFELINKARM